MMGTFLLFFSSIGVTAEKYYRELSPEKRIKWTLQCSWSSQSSTHSLIEILNPPANANASADVNADVSSVLYRIVI